VTRQQIYILSLQADAALIGRKMAMKKNQRKKAIMDNLRDNLNWIESELRVMGVCK